MIYVTRRERFSAAHRLYRADWADTKNLDVFGLCSNPNWHGHNYELFVTVKGEIDPETGFLVNLKLLSAVIKGLIINKIDHKNLNLEVDFLKNKITSTENVAVAIWNELKIPVNELGCSLHSIKLVETENNSAEYFG